MGINDRVAIAVVGLALLSGPAHAIQPERWIPLRWPHAAPYSPETLELLRGTPINCVLVKWTQGATASDEARRSVRAFAEHARSLGVDVLGVVTAEDLAHGCTDRRESGLAGVVLQGAFTDAPAALAEFRRSAPAGMPVVFLSPGSPRPEGIALFGSLEGAEARVRTTEGDAAVATPSSEPWIDTNLSLVRSMIAARGRPVWLGSSLEKPPAADCFRTIADVAAEGGRWVISPDVSFLEELRRQKPEAVAAWRRISSYLEFFEKHSEWRGLSPAGGLGVIQDSAVKDPEVFGETLNLLMRRRVPYRIIPRPSLGTASLDGLTAVLSTGLPAPTDAERALLAQFVERGGLLVAGSNWSKVRNSAGAYSIVPSGKGQAVVYHEELPDPETVARDMPSLFGRNRLAVRIFNGPSVLCPARISSDGSRMLVQLINYASLPAEDVTVRVAGAWRTARILSPDDAPADAVLEQTGESVQTRIRNFKIYAALLFER